MKLIINLALQMLLIFLSYSAHGQTKQVNTDTLVNRLGETFMKDKRAVGLSIGVYNNGATSYYNFGTTEKGKTIQPTQNTVYEIGSVTKAFVSLILANAIIEKKVQLNDDVRKYLDGNYPNLEYKRKPITLEQLANTTSGIPNWLPETPEEM